MENQNNNLQELEQLRSQVAEFKNRLEQQEIVSRQMLEEAMKAHVAWIKQMSVWGGVVDLALVPLIVYILKSIVGVSWLPIIAVCIGMVFEAFFNFWNVSTIRDKYLAANNVINTQQRLRTYKRREKRYTFFAIPFLLLWFIWFLLEVHYGTNIPSSRLVISIVMFIIIAPILFLVYNREMRSLNKAIKDIDEFVNGK